MVNIEPSEFQKFIKIVSMFVGLYAIIFGLLLGTNQPKLKKKSRLLFNIFSLFAKSKTKLN